MSYPINADEISGCTCRRARRLSRQLTQLFDHALKPAGITPNQFDVLAHLNHALISGEDGIAIGVLAERIVMHPTTVNRDLAPLLANRLASERKSTSDGRVRAVRITAKGRRTLAKAIPFWRKAQRSVEAALGKQGTRRLNSLLDSTSERIK